MGPMPGVKNVSFQKKRCEKVRSSLLLPKWSSRCVKLDRWQSAEVGVAGTAGTVPTLGSPRATAFNAPLWPPLS